MKSEHTCVSSKVYIFRHFMLLYMSEVCDGWLEISSPHTWCALYCVLNVGFTLFTAQLRLLQSLCILLLSWDGTSIMACHNFRTHGDAKLYIILLISFFEHVRNFFGTSIVTVTAQLEVLEVYCVVHHSYLGDAILYLKRCNVVFSVVRCNYCHFFGIPGVAAKYAFCYIHSVV